MYLVRRDHRYLVHDVFLVFNDAHGEAVRAVGIPRRQNLTGQDQCLVQRFNGDGRTRQHPFQGYPQAAQIVIDRDPPVEEDAFFAVHGIDDGLARLFRHQIDKAGGLYLDIGDVGVGDENRGCRPVEADQRSFRSLEPDRLFAGAEHFGSGRTAGGSDTAKHGE